MGMNYYYSKAPPCPACGNRGSGLHLGKSSFGWYFNLQVYPNSGINTLDDWLKLLDVPGSYVVNEENETLLVWQMRNIICYRQHSVESLLVSPDENYEVGEHNLYRFKVEFARCVGHHPSLPCSYLKGDFS